ncbi:MAG TPA: quinolinate synthase NadA [Candidatus Binatia bacterium]|jgi:quinolinate synthase|nr:quinolinate synthase NadA [Candidatus Binatia bacterium]
MHTVYGGEKTPQELYDHLSKLDSGYTLEACATYADWIREIKALKQEHNAVVLAHNYQRPEIFEVADFIGDSLELARAAKRVSSDMIVFCGVHFMAETAKVVNPERTVLLPDLRAGCSLSESITAEALADRKAELRKVYPDLKVVCYVNTTADVKAESDVCCTSANALQVVEALDSQHILFVPDENLARYVQSQTAKTILSWEGNCYVHHQITPEHILSVRRSLPHVKILVHPECREDVIQLADAVLSTSAMMRYAKESPAQEFLIVTECGLSDRLLLEVPEKKFYKSCKLCAFMKMITLNGVLDSLRHRRYEISLPEEVRVGAERSLERMLQLSA